jgi:hypothetical protein
MTPVAKSGPMMITAMTKSATAAALLTLPSGCVGKTASVNNRSNNDAVKPSFQALRSVQCCNANGMNNNLQANSSAPNKDLADREAKMSLSYIERTFIHSNIDKGQSSSIKGSAKKWAGKNTFTPNLAIEQDNVILKFPFNGCTTLSLDSIIVYELKDAMTIKEQLVKVERFSVWRMETKRLNDEKGVPSSDKYLNDNLIQVWMSL